MSQTPCAESRMLRKRLESPSLSVALVDQLWPCVEMARAEREFLHIPAVGENECLLAQQRRRRGAVLQSHAICSECTLLYLTNVDTRTSCNAARSMQYFLRPTCGRFCRIPRNAAVGPDSCVVFFGCSVLTPESSSCVADSFQDQVRGGPRNNGAGTCGRWFGAHSLPVPRASPSRPPPLSSLEGAAAVVPADSCDRLAQRLTAQRAHLDARQLIAVPNLGPQRTLQERTEEVGAQRDDQ